MLKSTLGTQVACESQEMHNNFAVETFWKISVERPPKTWDYNIGKYFTEVGCVDRRRVRISFASRLRWQGR
jgi:hypothetical protein